MADVWKAFLTICPRLKLVAYIFAPSIWKCPAEDLNYHPKRIFLYIGGLIAKNGGLNESVN